MLRGVRRQAQNVSRTVDAGIFFVRGCAKPKFYISSFHVQLARMV